MKTYQYTNKPAIKSPKDLLAFLKPIPAGCWCVDTRTDYAGRHCVLGHLDAAYSMGNGRDGFTDHELALANNGGTEYDIYARKPGTKTTGGAIKARVLRFVRSRIKP